MSNPTWRDPVYAWIAKRVPRRFIEHVLERLRHEEIARLKAVTYGPIHMIIQDMDK